VARISLPPIVKQLRKEGGPYAEVIANRIEYAVEDWVTACKSLWEPAWSDPQDLGKPMAQIALYGVAKGKGMRFASTRAEQTNERLSDIHINSEVETLYLWDGDGQLMFAIMGEEGSVGFSVDGRIWDGRNYNGESWHNHPANSPRAWGFPPSPTDVMSHMTNGHRASWVQANEGIYLMRNRALSHLGLSSREVDEYARRARDDCSRVWDAAIKNIGSSAFYSERKGCKLIEEMNKGFAEVAKRNGFEYIFRPSRAFLEAKGLI
jgi:hypothetical protein